MKIKTTIMFDEDSYTELKNFAHTNNESIGTVVRTAVDYLLKGKILAETITTEYISSVSPSTVPSTTEALPVPVKEIQKEKTKTETPNDDGTMPPLPITPKEEKTNIHLSGKVKTCPFCNEPIPIELAQKHYNDKHEGA